MMKSPGKRSSAFDPEPRKAVGASAAGDITPFGSATRRLGRRTGFTLTEALVACTLVGSIGLLLLPIAGRTARVQQQLAHERLALDELSNQLERLSELSLAELQAEALELHVSEETAQSLPDAELKALLSNSQGGWRLSLQLRWDEPGRRDNPLTITTWIFPGGSAPVAPAKESL